MINLRDLNVFVDVVVLRQVIQVSLPTEKMLQNSFTTSKNDEI